MKEERQSSLKWLKVDNFLKYFKKFDMVLEWVDYCRVSLDEPIKYFEDLPLNFTNQNSIVREIFGYNVAFMKLRLQFGLCIMVVISYNDVPIPLFLYNILDVRKNIDYRSYWTFTIYGSTYKFAQKEKLSIDQFLEEIIWKSDFEKIQDSDLSRLDYRFDFCSYEEKSFPGLNLFMNQRKEVRSRIHKKWKDEIQSWDCWSRKSKRVYYRMYNKIDEIKKYQKLAIYDDYLQFKTVQRFEFELLNKFCKWYKYRDIDAIILKLKQLIKLDDEKFSWKIYYEAPECERRYDKWDTDTNMTMFKWMWDKSRYFYKCWYNPFIILYQSLLSKNNKLQDKVDINILIKWFMRYLEKDWVIL